MSLLFELSRRLEGLVIRVVDADGEFMLIEAAEHLPQWANPETCSNRVNLFYILIKYMDSRVKTFHNKDIKKKFTVGCRCKK